MRGDGRRDRRWHVGGAGAQRGIQHEPAGVLAGGGDHQQPQSWPGGARIDALDDGQRIVDIGAAPAPARIGDLEIPAGSRAAAAHANAGRAHVQETPGLVLGEHAGDVVVDDDHLVGQPLPLRRKDADCGAAAPDPHPRLRLAVDDRRPAGLHYHLRAAVDRERHRLAVGEGEQRRAGDYALPLAAAGEVAHAAEAEHLAAVFAGGDMPDRLAVRADRRGFGAEVAIGVDLHLQAAIGEHALGDDGDHVHAVDLAADDERRRLVVRVGGPGADRGDHHVAGGERIAVPPAGTGVLHEPHRVRGSRQHRERIHARETTLDVAVAVAGAGVAGADAAQHRAGVAGDDPVGRRARFGQCRRVRAGRAGMRRHRAARSAAKTRSGVAGTVVIRTPVACSIAPRIAGAVAIRAGSPMPLAP